jgi:hypothetical protein
MLHSSQVIPANQGFITRWNTALRKFVLKAVVRLERIKLEKNIPFRGYNSLEDISDLISKILVVDSRWGDSYSSWILSDQDLRLLRAQNIDLVIVLGCGVLPENFSQVASLGALSLEESGSRRSGGLMTGFWEVFRKDSRSYFEIQHHGDSTNVGAVIERGSVATQTYFLRNQAHINMISALRILAVIQRIAISGGIPPADIEERSTDQLFGFPNLKQMSKYCWDQFLRLLRKKLGSLPVSKSPKWRVAVARESWQSVVLSEGVEIQPARGSWLADPFVIERDGRYYCFVEEFVEEMGKGRISVYDLTCEEPNYLGVALEEDFHLSFPFVFESDGDLFMCPESHEANQVRLYRNTGDILSWELSTVLIENIRAVDNLIFWQEGSWTLLTSIDETGAGDFSTGLWCFQSEQLLSSNWKLQDWKPANIQCECVRNGGLLGSEAHYFRVGQVSDFGEYGSRVHINRVGESGSEYSEQFSAEVTPKFSRSAIGLHHISCVDSVTVFDYYS